MKEKKNDEGMATSQWFTLIELLVAIAISAILAALLLPAPRRSACWVVLIVATLLPSALWAHDPLDCSSRLTVAEDRIQLTVTMGLDGVREILTKAGFSPQERTETIASRGPQASRELPVTLAAQLFEMRIDAQTLAAQSVVGLSDGMEVEFRVEYPRPPAGVLELYAKYFDAIGQMRFGWLAAYDHNQNELLVAMLAATNRGARVPLPAVKTTEQPGAPEVAVSQGQSAVSRSSAGLPPTGVGGRQIQWLGLCGLVLCGLWLVFWMQRSRKGARMF